MSCGLKVIKFFDWKGPKTLRVELGKNEKIAFVESSYTSKIEIIEIFKKLTGPKDF